MFSNSQRVSKTRKSVCMCVCVCVPELLLKPGKGCQVSTSVIPYLIIWKRESFTEFIVRNFARLASRKTLQSSTRGHMAFSRLPWLSTQVVMLEQQELILAVLGLVFIKAVLSQQKLLSLAVTSKIQSSLSPYTLCSLFQDIGYLSTSRLAICGKMNYKRYISTSVSSEIRWRKIGSPCFPSKLGVFDEGAAAS